MPETRHVPWTVELFFITQRPTPRGEEASVRAPSQGAMGDHSSAYGGPLTRSPSTPTLTAAPWSPPPTCTGRPVGPWSERCYCHVCFVCVARSFQWLPRDEHFLHRHMHSDQAAWSAAGWSDPAPHARDRFQPGQHGSGALSNASLPRWREWLRVVNGHSAPSPFLPNTSVSNPLAC